MAPSIGKLIALAALVASVAAQNCPCPRHYNPKCGSNGVTYGNECTFKCARSADPSISLRHPGKCRSRRSAEEPCVCPDVLQPTCGSDGNTYDNPCLLQCEARTKPDLEIASKGACASPKTCICGRHYRPVCGSDGATYANPCLLTCAQRTKPGLKLSHNGDCSETRRQRRPAFREGLCVCTQELYPICGSNGRTYGNPCLLKCASKYNKKLEMAHEGSCLEESKEQ